MTTTYFKATRPDATDFFTGEILYEVGRTVKPAPSSRREICGPGYLHASDVAAESLIGGRWPCRLFEVTGKPEVGFSGQHLHKAGFRQLKVVAEIDPYLALGPNGRYVAGVIERSRQADREEIRRLAAARRAAWRAAWDAAWRAAWDAAWRATRDAAWGAARDAARDAARGAAWDAMRDAARDATRDAAWRAAREAAWNAAWGATRGATRGALARDLITPEQYKVLTGPWVSVMGPIRMAPPWKGPGWVLENGLWERAS